MIKVFRKIRKKLLAQGRLRKYLVYSAGEILLLVIGILIALQVNNWNEGRKEDRLMDQYKVSLLRDMEDDLASIQVRIDLGRIRAEGAERLINYLDGKVDYDEFRKREDLMRAGWVNFFSPTLSTYNDLISSGNIKLVTDDSLKQLLNDYVNHNLRIQVYEEHDKMNVWDQYGLYYRKWVDGRMSSAYLSGDSLRVMSYPLDWKGILEDSDLKRRLTLVLETNYGQIARYERLKEKVDHFINFLGK